VGYDVDF